MEKEELHKKGVADLLLKGLTLAYAMGIEKAFRERERKFREPKKMAATALFLAVTNDTQLFDYCKYSVEETAEFIENRYEERGHGILSMKELVRSTSDDEKRFINELQDDMVVILLTVSVESWNHLMENQEKRMKQAQLNSLFMDMN